jgi:hypothetical protein
LVTLCVEINILHFNRELDLDPLGLRAGASLPCNLLPKAAGKGRSMAAYERPAVGHEVVCCGIGKERRVACFGFVQAHPRPATEEFSHFSKKEFSEKVSRKSPKSCQKNET